MRSNSHDILGARIARVSSRSDAAALKPAAARPERAAAIVGRPAPSLRAARDADLLELGPALAESLLAVRDRILAQLGAELPAQTRRSLSRRKLAAVVGALAAARLAESGVAASPIEQRDLVTAVMQRLMANAAEPPQPSRMPPQALPEVAAEANVPPRRWSPAAAVLAAKAQIEPTVLERLDMAAVASMPVEAFRSQLQDWVKELLSEARIRLNFIEQGELVGALVDNLLGHGPLEPLLRDDSVADIMVNGAKQVYVERDGKLELTDIQFTDDRQVINIATRIATRIGRRIDESTPLVDARLPDGSRVNIIIPPLAIDWPMISIRKFARKAITLDRMAEQGNISPQMASLLKLAARCRLSILISGGTGSGKTTLLNALSQLIDPAERIVTIEDAAELQLQQPHVGRLEVRPPSLEGTGEITMRDLLRNALRMRPDRIILGEIRGAESLDVLQAMNTGHDGSMSTIHANAPREALTRLENLVGMTGLSLPARSVRMQIASAVHLVCQVNRMRDGLRRVTRITEVVGMEGDTITTHDLFTYEFRGEGTDGNLRGVFKSANILPKFLPRAEYYGLDGALREAVLDTP